MYGIALLLLAVVAGYWLLKRSQSQRGSLKRLGRILGIVVIAAALVAILCPMLCGMTGRSCPLIGKKAGFWCPYTSSSKAQPASQK